MMFRRVCSVVAGLTILFSVMFYLLPWLLSLPLLATLVELDAWHDGHSIFSRSVALMVLFGGLLLWGIRSLSDEPSQIGISAGLSIGSVFVVASLAYMVLSGSAAQKIDLLASSTGTSTTANVHDVAREAAAPLMAASVRSTALARTKKISNTLVWLLTGLVGMVGIVFGVSIMPAGKSHRRRRRISGSH